MAGTESNGPKTANSPPREKLKRLESCVVDVVARHSPNDVGLVVHDHGRGVTIESNTSSATGQFIVGSADGNYNTSPIEEKAFSLFQGEYVREAPREEAVFSLTIDSHSSGPDTPRARTQDGHLRPDGTIETVGGLLDPETSGIDQKQKAVNTMAREVKACFESKNSSTVLRKTSPGFKP